jgi:hypothetical protein
MNLKDMLGQFAGNLPGRALQISWLKIDANGRDRRQIGDRLSLWTALLQRVDHLGTCRTVTSARTSSRSFGNRNVVDIDPARTNPGGDWSSLEMDRPTQAGRLPGTRARPTHPTA